MRKPLSPELKVHVDAIAKGKGVELTEALARATAALGPPSFDALLAAAMHTLVSRHATIAHAEPLADFFVAAVKSLAKIDPVRLAISGKSPLGVVDEALREVVTEATASLPIAKRLVELLQERVEAEPALAKYLRGSALFFFHTDGYDGPPIPFKSAGGASTTGVIYARLDLLLTLAPPTAEDRWDFCMKLVAKIPTARGLPEEVKQARITQLNDLDVGYLFALLRAGLAHKDPAIARVVIADAIAQFERLKPEEKNLLVFARAAKLSPEERSAFAAFVRRQKKIGKVTAILADAWSALGQGGATAPATPKDVLVALGDKRWADARAMLEAGVNMRDPGCRPDGAIHLVQRAPDDLKYPLIELLFERGLHVDDEGLSGSTGLQAACYARDYELARFLLERGAWVDADMDTSTGHSETSLHAAVERGDRKMVELLLEFGANPKLKNWNGETAIEVAEGEIKKLLTKKK